MFTNLSGKVWYTKARVLPFCKKTMAALSGEEPSSLPLRPSAKKSKVARSTVASEVPNFWGSLKSGDQRKGF